MCAYPATSVLPGFTYSTWDSSGDPDPALQAGLDRASGFLRSHLARELSTRTVPDLRFQFDDHGAKSRELDVLIDTAVATSSSGESPDADPEVDSADGSSDRTGKP